MTVNMKEEPSLNIYFYFIYQIYMIYIYQIYIPCQMKKKSQTRISFFPGPIAL